MIAGAQTNGHFTLFDTLCPTPQLISIQEGKEKVLSTILHMAKEGKWSVATPIQNVLHCWNGCITLKLIIQQAMNSIFTANILTRQQSYTTYIVAGNFFQGKFMQI